MQNNNKSKSNSKKVKKSVYVEMTTPFRHCEYFGDWVANIKLENPQWIHVQCPMQCKECPDIAECYNGHYKEFFEPEVLKEIFNSTQIQQLNLSANRSIDFRFK